MSRFTLTCAAQSLVVLSLVALLSEASHGAVVTIRVAQDASVNAANPDGNLNNITTRGGLLSGLDDTGSDYSFFLQYNLAEVAGRPIHSAGLVGYYTDDFGPVDSFHQPYFVADDAWTESTVTWNTRPALGAATADGFDASSRDPGGTIRFDVTAEVVGEAEGDGIVSFGVATIDGRLGDLEFFASREFDPFRAFRLDVVVVPLPVVAPLAGLLIACGVTLLETKRRTRAPRPSRGG
jgi:hypothetical protein